MKIVNVYSPFVAQHAHVPALIIFVLTQSEADDYAAYMGLVHYHTGEDDQELTRDSARVQWIAHHGSKLSERQARAFFDIPEGKYRK